MEYQDIIFSKESGVARITFNRPEKLNAFRAQTLREMAAALEDVEEDATIGVLVISGKGDKAFCVGGDAKETGGEGGYKPEVLLYASKVHDLIRRVPVPVIVIVAGLSGAL